MRQTESADQLQVQMEELRLGLGRNVERGVTNVRTMLDWRHYVATHPWLCLAAAAATGYLLVPRRPTVVQLSPEHLAELSRQSGILLKAEARHGTPGGALANIATAAANTLLRVTASRLADYLEHRFWKGDGRGTEVPGRK